MKKKTAKAAEPTTEERIRALLKLYGTRMLGLLVAVMIVHDLFGTHGFLAMRRTRHEINSVKADISRLSKENAQFEKQVKDLKTDPKLIEKIARDDLGLARPGETIIRIPQGQPLQDSPVVKH